MNNPLNWTVTQLREKLTELGINVPKGFSAATLHQLYNENVKNNNVNVEQRENLRYSSVLGGNDVTNPNKVLLQTLQTISQSSTALQQTVNTILEGEKRKGFADFEEDNLLRKFADQCNSDAGRKTLDNICSEHINMCLVKRHWTC